MRYDWDPARVAFIDFETQSAQDLVTRNKYFAHPSTRALTCVVKVDGEYTCMGPGKIDRGLLSRVAAERTMVAHNAPFDSGAWASLGLPEAVWYDTLPVSRAAGLPGKLDDIGTWLFGRGKDPNGKRLIDMLCILRGRPVPPETSPAYALLLDYNRRDVELLEQVYGAVRGFEEPDVLDVDRAINDRGVPVDVDHLTKLLGLFTQNADKLRDEFHSTTGGVNPGSPKQVIGWMKSMGFRVPVVQGKESIGKFALKDFTSHPNDFFVGDGEEDAAVEAVLEAIESRREVVRVGKGKAVAALNAVEADGRVRDQLVYWGAHTGRWSGRSLQLHNMPKTAVDVRGLELDYGSVKEFAARASAKLGYRLLVADVLNAALRSAITAENFLVADYGAIEARGIAWLAGDRRMLDFYADPSKSMYLDLGRQVFGRPIDKKKDVQEYIMAKGLVLGCCYGMSGAKFEYICKSRGISTEVFAKAGLDTARAVKLYRETYPDVPAVWRAYGDAIHSAAEGGEVYAGRCLFNRSGADMHCTLPSGRRIVYRNARVEMRVPAWCRLFGAPEVPRPTVVYDSPRMKNVALWGSKVSENVCQAVCRDLLADALVRCEQAGLRPVLHVHDEIVCEAPGDRLREFMAIMSTGPAWADGLPILAEGYSGPVWSKVSEGYEELNMLLGRRV
jgi:DNA polymerase